jgi:hypothetical protein
MIKLRKSLVVAAAVATIGGVGVVSATAAQAAAHSSGSSDSLAQQIADRFGLNKDEVQQIVDENRTAHKAEREAKAAERLQQLVDDGTITAEQQVLIEAKMKELKEARDAKKEAFRELSHDERKARMDGQKAELEKWAEENGLDLSKLKGVLSGGHGPHGHR